MSLQYDYGPEDEETVAEDEFNTPRPPGLVLGVLVVIGALLAIGAFLSTALWITAAIAGYCSVGGTP